MRRRCRRGRAATERSPPGRIMGRGVGRAARLSDVGPRALVRLPWSGDGEEQAPSLRHDRVPCSTIVSSPESRSSRLRAHRWSTAHRSQRLLRRPTSRSRRRVALAWVSVTYDLGGGDRHGQVRFEPRDEQHLLTPRVVPSVSTGVLPRWTADGPGGRMSRCERSPSSSLRRCVGVGAGRFWWPWSSRS
jgi:hypothetical protein